MLAPYSWRCTWCDHAWPHALPCPGSIQTGTARAPEAKPCPCARRDDAAGVKTAQQPRT